jgi:outer membrane murein-binding lipoprotein Lpp
MTSIVKSVAAVGLTIAGFGLSGCATEKYVDEHIATVNGRIDGLEQKVAQVDSTAQSAAGAAQQANQRLDQLTGRVDGLEQQVGQLQAAHAAMQAHKKPRN